MYQRLYLETEDGALVNADYIVWMKPQVGTEKTEILLGNSCTKIIADSLENIRAKIIAAQI